MRSAWGSASGHDVGVNDERAAEGVDHLQRAAREMVAAARSFLDVVEELVEDRAALNEVASTLSGAASAVGEVMRNGLGGRPAPWEAAAWDDPARDDPPWEHDTDGVHDDDDDTEPWAASLATEQDATVDADTDRAESTIDLTIHEDPRPRTGRVRRITVD